MTHLKRMLVGLVMVMCITIVAVSTSVIIDLVVEILDINPIVLFYGFFGIVCVALVSYALGMISEEVLERRAREKDER